MRAERLWRNESLSLLLLATGVRAPRSSTSEGEREALRRLAADSRNVAEVGVFEGVTSALLAASLPSEGTLWLIDPFVPSARIERILGVSLQAIGARRSVRGHEDRVRWIPARSEVAAGAWKESDRLDLVFIDADHSYEAVSTDFAAWSRLLSPRGVVALHDSRICAERPDLRPEDGPVRVADELRSGVHGSWKEVAATESLTAWRRARTEGDPPTGASSPARLGEEARRP